MVVREEKLERAVLNLEDGPTARSTERIGEEIGDIPLGWRIATISTVADVKTGPFGSALHERDYVDEGTPIVTVEHLSEQGLIHNDLSLVSDADLSRLNSYELRAGDIVFSRVGSVDRNSLVRDDEDGWLFSGSLLRVRASADVYPPYLSYYFHSEPFKRRIRSVAVGQTRASLNTEILNAAYVMLPPIQEQHAIGEALSDVDALIQALDALIAKKQAIKHATMQQLLTGRIRLPGFSGKWETKRLGDVCTFLPTASYSRANLIGDGEFSYIHYGDIHAHSRPILDCEEIDLPRIAKGLVESVGLLQDGDLVMVDASEDLAGIGKAVEVLGIERKPIVAGLHTILCRGSSHHWALGFKAYLQFIPTFRTALTRMATGISVYGISKKQVANVELPLPSPIEQQAIATVFSDMDAETVALEHQLEKTRQIKEGMMQDLLTGRVRLVEKGS